MQGYSFGGYSENGKGKDHDPFKGGHEIDIRVRRIIMARRTHNALGEAIRLVRRQGGKRTIKAKANATKRKITSSRRGIPFVTFNEVAYKEKVKRLGGRRV